MTVLVDCDFSIGESRVKSVSYTHLDVYKRQSQYRSDLVNEKHCSNRTRTNEQFPLNLDRVRWCSKLRSLPSKQAVPRLFGSAQRSAPGVDAALEC